jgi:hypothetical protein
MAPSMVFYPALVTGKVFQYLSHVMKRPSLTSSSLSKTSATLLPRVNLILCESCQKKNRDSMVSSINYSQLCSCCQKQWDHDMEEFMISSADPNEDPREEKEQGRIKNLPQAAKRILEAVVHNLGWKNAQMLEDQENRNIYVNQKTNDSRTSIRKEEAYNVIMEANHGCPNEELHVVLNSSPPIIRYFFNGQDSS